MHCLSVLWIVTVIFAKNRAHLSPTVPDGEEYSKTLLKRFDIFEEIFEHLPIPDDTGLNMTEVTTKYGYPIEEHSVTTEDGYILSLYRIPHGRNEDTTARENSIKPVILLIHGLLTSAEDWVNLGPEKGLGLLLADQGYDVWLGNNRGNTYSRKHRTLDPDKDAEKFWDFSFDELGNYDLPAFIDYILEKTDSKKLLYLGHSQGSSQFFVLTSMKPEYNDKIDTMIALGPVAYMKNVPNPFVHLVAKYFTPIKLALKVLKINLYEILPHPKLVTYLGALFCNDNSGLQNICSTIIFMFIGFDWKQLDTTTLPVVLTSDPAGCSRKQMEHYLQGVRSGHFRRFDYGLENLKRYKSLKPPDYDLSKISVPVIMYYAQNDWLSGTEDVEHLESQLRHAEKHLVPFKEFNHLDYFWAKDIYPLLYYDVINKLNEISGLPQLPSTTSTSTTESSTTNNTTEESTTSNGGTDSTTEESSSNHNGAIRLIGSSGLGKILFSFVILML